MFYYSLYSNFSKIKFNYIDVIQNVWIKIYTHFYKTIYTIKPGLFKVLMYILPKTREDIPPLEIGYPLPINFRTLRTFNLYMLLIGVCYFQKQLSTRLQLQGHSLR